jgi:WD40 repeat protein
MLALALGFASGFSVPSVTPTTCCAINHPRANKLLCNMEDPDDLDTESIDQLSLFASLKARQVSLTAEVNARWRAAECKSSVPIVLDNYVRRLALEWPRAALGTADGRLVVADLASGDLVAYKRRAHPSRVDTPASSRDMRLLHGDYDGGGLTAIVLRGDLVVSAGRDGGAALWRIASKSDGAAAELQQVARLHEDGPTKAAVVSAIQITAATGAAEDGRDDDDDDAQPLCVWLAGLDGLVRRWEYHPEWAHTSGEAPLRDAAAPKCSLTIRAESAVLDMAILEKRGLLACANAVGGVEIFSLEDGARVGSWYPLRLAEGEGRSGERARSVAFVPVCGEGTAPPSYCLVVGGSDGALHARFLGDDANDDAGDPGVGDPFAGAPPPLELTPSHGGACVALTPLGEAASGLFVSGAHDGTCRLWDLDWSPDKGLPPSGGGVGGGGEGPVCLFGLGGYKVWLGSVATDGRRLVSDGRDNSVLVHDFSEPPKGEAA